MCFHSLTISLWNVYASKTNKAITGTFGPPSLLSPGGGFAYAVRRCAIRAICVGLTIRIDGLDDMFVSLKHVQRHLSQNIFKTTYFWDIVDGNVRNVLQGPVQCPNS